MIKREQSFTTEFQKLLKTYLVKKPFSWKIPDLGFKNPFDFFMITQWYFYAIEFKYWVWDSTFNLLENISWEKKIHQLFNLLDVKQNWWIWIYVIYHQKSHWFFIVDCELMNKYVNDESKKSLNVKDIDYLYLKTKSLKYWRTFDFELFLKETKKLCWIITN